MLDERTGDEIVGFQFAFCWGDVELELFPPVATFEQVLGQARAARVEHGDEHGYHYVVLLRDSGGNVYAAGGSFTGIQMDPDGELDTA